jgi:hypothetical protein
MPVKLKSLRTRREEAGLSISDVARLSNTSDLAVNRLEMTPTPGTVSHEEADRIANVIATTHLDGRAIIRAFAGFEEV